MNLKNLYKKWSTWEMSTLKFLMISNIYYNRSLNDVNQYLVFPWIITNYTAENYNSLLNDKNLIRPFGVPMGMMDITEGAENRKNNFWIIGKVWKKTKKRHQIMIDMQRIKVPHYMFHII